MTGLHPSGRSLRVLVLGLVLLLSDGSVRADESGAAATCPPQMALIDGAFCIDRYEGALERRDGDRWTLARRGLPVGKRPVRARPAHGIRPYAYVSARGAERACANAGKRLCTSEEWLKACRGPRGHRWPYGPSYSPDACNDTYPGGHPVIDYFDRRDGVWDEEHMNHPALNEQPDTVDPGGANAGCVSDYGVYDMHGNLHEWVADADGTFRGGFYGDASRNGVGCDYVTTAHHAGYRDYSTGFRCCADPKEAGAAPAGR